MKTIIFVLLALPIIITSCHDNDNICEQNNSNVVISFSSGALTKAFFDDSTEAESWEKQINTAFIVVFDPNGKTVVRKDLTASEIAAGQAVFSVTRDVLGKECSFYAIANLTWNFDILTKNDLLRLLDTQISAYNGKAEEVMSGCVREEGFIMTGKTLKTVAQYGSTTHVSITLKRNVAKIAFRYTLGDEFYSVFKGASVRIDKVTVRNTYPHVMMLEESGFQSGSNRSYFYEQEPFRNGALFYVYPMPSQDSETDYALLQLDGVFAPNGNFNAVDELLKVQYQLPIEGSGKGEIKRNGYYRIETTIRGISGQDVSALLTASGWESPYTQFTGVGK